MIGKLLGKLVGDPNEKQLKLLQPIVDDINAHEDSMRSLMDDDLAALTYEFKSRLNSGESIDDILPEAFAAVREASSRVLGMRHFDVQMIGGITLHEGKIAEMRTGEGKTLSRNPRRLSQRTQRRPRPRRNRQRLSRQA